MSKYHDHRSDCPFKFASLDVCDCVEHNMLDRIEALTEQLEAARADAKEAEAYAEELEAMNKNQEAMIRQADRRGDALETKLAKTLAALREWDDLIKHQYSGSREAMSDMTYAAQHTAALLAEIEGEK